MKLNSSSTSQRSNTSASKESQSLVKHFHAAGSRTQVVPERIIERAEGRQPAILIRSLAQATTTATARRVSDLSHNERRSSSSRARSRLHSSSSRRHLPRHTPSHESFEKKESTLYPRREPRTKLQHNEGSRTNVSSLLPSFP